MPIVTVTSEDGATNEIQVPADAVELKEKESPTDLPGVQDEINRITGKVRRQTRRSTKESLLEDDEYWQQAAQQRGVDLREDDLMPTGASRGEVKELKKSLAKAKAKASRVDELEQQVQRTRDTRLENELLQHADGVKSDMKDLFLHDAKSQFVYDEADDEFVPTDEEGNPAYGRGAEDVISEIRERRPSMFKPTGANGSGTDAGRNSSSGAYDTVDAWNAAYSDSMSDEEFAEWKAARP